MSVFTLLKNPFDKLIASAHWKFYCALILFVYSMIVAPPELSYFLQHNVSSTMEMISHQIDNLFTPVTKFDPSSHEGKLAYRLTVPIIGKLATPLSITGRLYFIYAVQLVLGFVAFYMVCRIYYRKFADRRIAMLFAVNIALTYFGKAFFLDATFFDAIAFFLVSVAMFSGNPFVIFFCLLAAFYTDERAIFSGVFAYCYHFINREDDARKKLITVKELWVLLAAVVYAGTRLYLGHRYNLNAAAGKYNDLVPLQFLRGDRLDRVPIGLFSPFKALWVVMPFTIYLLRKNLYTMAVYLFALGALLVICLSVVDLTRSLAFAFPALLIGGEMIGKHLKNNALFIKMLFVLAVVNFLTPSYFVMTSIQWVRPFFLYDLTLR